MSDPGGEGPVLEAEGLVKEFRGGDGGVLRVLDGASLRLARGEMVAIVGASGSGKSTLLHLLGALERPNAGTVRLAGSPVEALSDEALAALRNRAVGFVFQFHHLLREFSAVENVMMPLRIAGVPVGEARARAMGLLERVGLTARAHHRPGALSGGSSSGRRWRGRWRPVRRWCWRTNRAGTWTPGTRSGCTTCWGGWRVMGRWG